MYYFLIILSSLCFAVSNIFNSKYQENEGNTLLNAIKLGFWGSVFGMFYILIISFGKLEFSMFSLLIAFFAAINNVLCTYLVIKVLSFSDLTTFSLFSMLGGMLLPSLFSIIFYNENLDVKKVLCIVFIVASLFVTTLNTKSKVKNKEIVNLIYMILLFVFNGMSGVYTKIHQYGNNAVSSNSYIFLQYTFALIITTFLIFYFIKKKTYYKFVYPLNSILYAGSSSLLTMLGNLLLLISVLRIDASIQYPLNTGGVIVLSVIIDAILGKKPTFKQIISVVLAVIGTCILIF